MFKKLIEKKQEIQKLQKDCFDARKNLIVVNGGQLNNEPACIKLQYSVVSCIAGPWVDGINPENTYRVVGPSIHYCQCFDPKNPLKNVCKNKSCLMYEKYQRYLDACRALKSEKNK